MFGGQSGTYSLLGLMVMMGLLDQPNYRKLAYWLARETKAGGGRAWGFAMVWEA